MKQILGFVVLLALNITAWGQQPLAEFNWTGATAPQGTAAITLDSRGALKIVNTNDTPLQVSLLTIQKPKISAAMYAVTGEVRYDAVQGDGFLEMWNYFPPDNPGLPEGGYFTRTLGESGAMGKISGTSEWRPFSLPFDSTGAHGAPTRLQINLILKGKGIVYLGPFKLAQFPGAKAGGRLPVWFYGDTDHPWWSPRMCLWGSNIASVLLMIDGALIAILCQKGKSWKFVLYTLKVWMGLGIASAMAAIAAFAQHQPYAVWFPLALFGLLLLLLSPVFILTWGRHYRQLELRRMQALDAAG